VCVPFSPNCLVCFRARVPGSRVYSQIVHVKWVLQTSCWSRGSFQVFGYSLLFIPFMLYPKCDQSTLFCRLKIRKQKARIEKLNRMRKKYETQNNRVMHAYDTDSVTIGTEEADARINSELTARHSDSSGVFPLTSTPARPPSSVFLHMFSFNSDIILSLQETTATTLFTTQWLPTIASVCVLVLRVVAEAFRRVRHSPRGCSGTKCSRALFTGLFPPTRSPEMMKHCHCPSGVQVARMPATSQQRV